MTLAQLRASSTRRPRPACATVYFEGGEPTLAYPVVLAAAAARPRRAASTSAW